MPRPSAPFSADDILATGTADYPVGIECAAQGNSARLLGHGWLDDETVQPGFEINAANYAAYEDYTVITPGQPGLFVGVNLGAAQTGQAGTLPYELKTNGLVMLSVREPIALRQFRAGGTQQIRCGIFIQEPWIDSGQFEELVKSRVWFSELISSHMRPLQARAVSSILNVASRMAASLSDPGPLGHLRRQTVGLELLLETLALAEQSRDLKGPPNRRELLWVKHVKNELDQLGPQDDIDLSKLAAQGGVSVRSLSRHFTATYGTTIFAYVAEKRMAAAHHALERHGATLDLAAYLAGYAHKSNFVTAYKRRYGRTPGSAVRASKPHEDLE